MCNCCNEEKSRLFFLDDDGDFTDTCETCRTEKEEKIIKTDEV